MSEEDRQYFVPYRMEDTLLVKRADSRVLSILRSNYQNPGGAHGMTTTVGYSFDPESGREMSVADVMNVSGTKELASVLADEVVKQNDPAGITLEAGEDLETKIRILLDGDQYFDETGFKQGNELHYVTWYVDQGGVTFIFDEYQRGAYASGKFYVTLTQNDYPDLIRYPYAYGPEEYITQLSNFDEYTVDGRKLSVGYGMSDGYIVDASVAFGDEMLDIPELDYTLNLRMYLITVPAGKFLYLDAEREGESRTLYSIDLGAESIKAADFDMAFDEEIPLDPENMILCAPTSLMSSMTVEGTFHVDGNSGKPVPNQKSYTVRQYADGIWFTLRKDTQLNVLDKEHGDQTHRETIKEGTRMQPCRTDNRNLMDCRTEDGRYIRFTVNAMSWPERVDEQYDLEELLDGTVFAG